MALEQKTQQSTTNKQQTGNQTNKWILCANDLRLMLTKKEHLAEFPASSNAVYWTFVPPS